MKYTLLNTARSIIEKNDGSIEIIAPARTDYFSDISSDYSKSNAPFYFTNIEGDFIFRCTVKPEFSEIYDAGGILAQASDIEWIKLAFEKTDLGHPSVVSVVTRNVSDDCNGESIRENAVRLQVVRKGDNWCLHYSSYKTAWKMVRYFRFELPKNICIGIFSQSPLGEGCSVNFSGIELLDQTYSNIRKAE
jgi:uncharacterized protein